ncbi:MAG: HepT-like ribonuclease domain-containing protein [Thermodesulfobacteriota bacterium]
MAGMRDKMIHHYFGINYDIVWKIAKEEISRLLRQVENNIEKEKV